MLKYNCIIVEDEPLAADVLKDYVDQIPFFELKAICADAIDAMAKLQEEKIDLMFLDINLPKLRGMEFLGALETPPRTIITTAYKEFALQGYELNIVDYLIKPISFSRFLRSISKLKNNQEQTISTDTNTNIDKRKFFFFNIDKKRVKIDLAEILYVESLREYVRIKTVDKNIVTKFQLNEIGNLFPKDDFIRIHRSYIVSKNKITAYTAVEVEINNIKLPIGRRHKILFWQHFITQVNQP